MPRQGDGSSDNGPIETGSNLVHGTSGDVRFLPALSPTLQSSILEYKSVHGLIITPQDSLKHASKVAPMPEPEKGAGTFP
ncbi:hypothetical protein BU23DRAFT_549816, partial [Bimuria novae-zelandiae CBS 107.79]